MYGTIRSRWWDKFDRNNVSFRTEHDFSKPFLPKIAYKNFNKKNLFLHVLKVENFGFNVFI